MSDWLGSRCTIIIDLLRIASRIFIAFWGGYSGLTTHDIVSCVYVEFLVCSERCCIHHSLLPSTI